MKNIKSTDCFCGNNITLSKNEINNCIIQCSGNNTQMCGSNQNITSIYKTSKSIGQLTSN